MKLMMRYFLLCIILGLSTSLFSQVKSDSVWIFSYFKNNGEDGLHLAFSYDGLQWTALNNDKSYLTPKVGVDKLMRDPCIIRGADGKFHMVWTVSWKERGIGYATSANLTDWSDQVYIPVMEHEPLAKNCWAPEITWDHESKNYMIYWATTIPGRFPATDSLGDHNHRIYYVTTKDFRTFTPAKLLYDKGFNVIDATVIRDKDEYIMFLKDETLKPVAQKNVRISRSKKLTGGYSGPTLPITGNYWAEGPTLLRMKGKYILYFDKYMEKIYGAVESADLKNWTDISSSIHVPAGLRHGTIFRISSAEFKKLSE